LRFRPARLRKFHAPVQHRRHPAGGIGPEVIGAGIVVLKALEKRLGDVRFYIENLDWGSAYYRKHCSANF
jgi:isocitrate/isopropylmalate dehydrogenase